ncbi:MAG: hypothetical protein M3Q31_09965, partial [Actinomycetota bacterium]|nr:hypothetical protein [Actinomycetota bacterium]
MTPRQKAKLVCAVRRAACLKPGRRAWNVAGAVAARKKLRNDDRRSRPIILNTHLAVAVLARVGVEFDQNDEPIGIEARVDRLAETLPELWERPPSPLRAAEDEYRGPPVIAYRPRLAYHGPPVVVWRDGERLVGAIRLHSTAAKTALGAIEQTIRTALAAPPGWRCWPVPARPELVFYDEWWKVLLPDHLINGGRKRRVITRPEERHHEGYAVEARIGLGYKAAGERELMGGRRMHIVSGATGNPPGPKPEGLRGPDLIAARIKQAIVSLGLNLTIDDLKAAKRTTTQD